VPRQTGPMATTILAIYGAVISTASVLVGAWIFRASGPRLQAQAKFQPHFLDGQEEDSGDRTLIVKLWNTGRDATKVDLEGLKIMHRNGGSTFIPMYWHGPELPIWIPGHSGEEWWESVADLAGQLELPFEANKVLVELIEGGNREREIKIPISEVRSVIEDPIIMESGPHGPGSESS
jgi:hypothetical protein